MDKDTLKEYLRLHLLWVSGDVNGVRANLSWANLSRADLSGADLSRADLSRANLSEANLFGANLSKTILEGKAILSFQFQNHTAYFYGLDSVSIGCHTKSIQECI